MTTRRKWLPPIYLVLAPASLALFNDRLAVPQRSHTLTAAEQRGKAIFEAAGTQCVICTTAAPLRSTMCWS